MPVGQSDDMAALHDTEIDGVRCLWVDSGRPTLAASLWFRQGMADERLNTSGWTHLVEHVALHGRGGGTLAVNGSVGLLRTTFDAHGPADAVAAMLNATTRWLSDPDFAELDRERDVLAAEAAGGSGPAPRALSWRYGAQGPGIAGMSEAGLGRATPERLRELAAACFTAGNAILVLDGPPPPGLRLTLPAGAPRPPRSAVPCDDRRPASYADQAGLVVSGTVNRSHAAPLLPDLVSRALREQLRDRDGTAYSPWAAYEPVDHDRAVVIAASDVQPRALQTLAHAVLAITRRLAVDGPPEDHFRELVAARIQAVRDPYAALGIAAAAASEASRGLPARGLDEMVDALEAVTIEDVAADASAFRSSLLLGVPEGALHPDLLPVLSFPISSGGDFGYRNQNWPAVTSRLRIDHEAIAIGTTSAAQRIAAKDVEGLLVFPDGARHVVSRDGWGLTIEPAEWRHGDRGVDELDQLISRDLHLPQPPRHGRATFERAGAVHRWWPSVRAGSLLLLVLAAVVLALVAVLAAMVAGVVTGHPLVTGVLGVFLALVVYGLWKGEERGG